jgi:hypothetical protein
MASTKSLLRPGLVAGPFYMAVSLVQVFVRDGFDLRRHALSHLANGPGGWVQTANFALTGVMVIVTAIGFLRALRPTSRATSVFLAAFGVSMIVAAVYPADPVDGFPIGTPTGVPTMISGTGLIHFIAGGLGFTCLAISCFLAARALARRNEPGLSRFSFFAGLAVMLGFFAGPVLPRNLMILGIWVAVVAGWTWLSTLSHIFMRDTGRDPSMQPRQTLI